MPHIFLMSHIIQTFLQAAHDGDLGALQDITQHTTESLPHGQALSVASKRGHLVCVRYLPPLTNPFNEERAVALLNAADQGHDDCVAYLSPLCTDLDHTNVLRALLRQNQTQCLGPIFERAERTHRVFAMVQAAAKHNNTDYLDMLLEQEDETYVLSRVVLPDYHTFLEQHIAHRQNQRLRERLRDVVNGGVAAPRHKI